MYTIRTVNLFVTRSKYIIPLALFLSSTMVYAYNLEGQPWHGDEITYLGWGGNYVHLIKNGDLDNSCLLSLDDCHQLFHIPAFGLTYRPLRNVLVGIPMYLSGEDKGDFFNWSCYWDCYDHSNPPTVQEMTAGRLFSPIFGALSVIVVFLIGKLLFNKHVGILASLLFLFYDLWVWYSRSIMVEVHYIFFSILSLLLLLHSFRNGRMSIRYFIPSAIVFGIALNTKLLSVDFSFLFLGIILFNGMWNRNTSNVKTKHALKKTLVMSVCFFALSGLGLFLTQPGFYENPLHEISLMKFDMDNYNRDVWYIGYPTIQGLQPNAALTIFHYALFPSFIEKQISSPDLHVFGNLGWTYPPTFSSVPLTIFFFIGMIYAIQKIRKPKAHIQEMILLVWFSSTFIFSMVIVKDFSLERYLMPLIISIIFIGAYGFWNFTKNIRHVKMRIIFVILFLVSHAVTSLSYWEKIYFSPGTMWVNPLHYGTLQQSLDNPFSSSINFAFIGFLIFITVWHWKKNNKKFSISHQQP